MQAFNPLYFENASAGLTNDDIVQLREVNLLTIHVMDYKYKSQAKKIVFDWGSYKRWKWGKIFTKKGKIRCNLFLPKN